MTDCLPRSCGVIYVAFGDRAIDCCKKSIETLRQMHGDLLNVAVISDRVLAEADIPIVRKDVSSLAREYKTRVYWYSPFQYTLYLDADTEIVGDVACGFHSLLNGWDMAAAFDFRETLADIDHLQPEDKEFTIGHVGAQYATHYNTGVLFFRKNEAVRDLFLLWHSEWRRFRHYDQGAFVRAIHGSQVKVWTLAPEWNTHIKKLARRIWHKHHHADRTRVG